MKRVALIKRIRAEARRCGVEWRLHHEGANHTIFYLGETMIPVPRHAEVGEQLAEEIFKECEPELGRRWWKR